ncbi:MAG TPA: YbaB/EbfC family nucleoid-associated protein [Pirellulales bacterium]|jgi:DNA-binding YbaB/EbfC family protein|nr:YbaB/EbfC family nucleoid-associated protein [Pirellulales bacterium]
MFKGIGNLSSILKQAQEVGGRLQSLNEELKKRRVVGRSGADLIEVEANGIGQILKITIDPGLVERRDREMLEDLIPAAVNQALAKAKEMHADALRDLTGGMNLPPLDDLMAKIQSQET